MKKTANKSKADFFKYLTVGDEDKQWGIELLNAGVTEIFPYQNYPPLGHPPEYNFNWQSGRTLDSFSIIYITKGKGVFESKTAETIPVSEGSIILLFPGEWHRYKPNKKSGWKEYFVAAKGKVITELLANDFFKKERPILKIGADEKIIELFQYIISTIQKQPVSFMQVAAGAFHFMISLLYAHSKQNHRNSNRTEQIIQKAKVIFHQHVDSNISGPQVASRLNVSYPWFRRMFKHYTNISPNQYHQQLKIQKAKDLLSDPSKAIKEVSSELGYDSAYHFSKIFKTCTGYAPSHFKRIKTQFLKTKS